MKIIDIGVPLDAAPYPPWNYRFKRVSHEEGARAMLRLFKGSDVGDYPSSMALGWETITLTGHAGNHIDAPWHFGPLCEGKPGAHDRSDSARVVLRRRRAAGFSASPG